MASFPSPGSGKGVGARRRRGPIRIASAGRAVNRNPNQEAAAGHVPWHRMIRSIRFPRSALAAGGAGDVMRRRPRLGAGVRHGDGQPARRPWPARRGGRRPTITGSLSGRGRPVSRCSRSSPRQLVGGSPGSPTWTTPSLRRPHGDDRRRAAGEDRRHACPAACHNFSPAAVADVERLDLAGSQTPPARWPRRRCRRGSARRPRPWTSRSDAQAQRSRRVNGPLLL